MRGKGPRYRDAPPCALDPVGGPSSSGTSVSLRRSRILVPPAPAAVHGLCYVEVCPTGARYLGDLKNPRDPIHEFLRTHKVQVLKPQMATHPKAFYNGLDAAVR